ncbi:beta-ketoacyl synthase N-terminal-like domain-containing protein [Pseudomonas sp. NPDC089554]|uniref:beta-ketoacyl synthase N-terminal-like domain-containing protein n=1 Tax=Pseudomonas sp. NPDC089554 TaxID=3390653 RepID=UPI003CFC2CD6
MNDQAIAIIGMSCRLPAARDAQALWRNLLAGKVCSTRYDAAQLRRMGVSDALIDDPAFVPVDARLADADQFDPEFFAMSQREAQLLDPQHRLLLECAWELTQTTGLGNPLRRPRIGLFAGCSLNTYLLNVIGGECDLMSAAGTERMLANDKDYMTARVSYKLGLEGPSVSVQTGCSSSLSAVHLAVNSLLLGECEIAFAGGVSFHALARPGYLYQPDLMFSRDGSCRPFDAQASGTFFGDGVGLVALRPLEDALLAGDSIRAVILGSAANNDGAGRAGFTAPGVDGQRQLILQALALAQVDAQSIGMIEAHGTATSLGDPVEFDALCQAFAQHTERQGFCALGSIKANVGHLAAAAGFAGLARGVLSVSHGCIPPHPTFERANPACDLARSPFLINTRPMEWLQAPVRRAGVSSFGAGGSNVHLVLEQAPARPVQVALGQPQVVVLSGRDQADVHTVADALAEQVAREPGLALEQVARGFAEGRASLAWRAVLEVSDLAQLRHEVQARRFRVTKVHAEPRSLCIAVNESLMQAMAQEPGYQLCLRQSPDQGQARLEALARFLGQLLPGHVLVFALEASDSVLDVDLPRADEHPQADALLDLNTCGHSLRAGLGRFWAQGGRVDWALLRAGRLVAQRELPFAPLRPRRCWFTPQAPNEVAAPHRATVYVEQWAQQGLLHGFASTQVPETLQLLGASQGLRQALRDALGRKGVRTMDDDLGVASDARVIWLLDERAAELDAPSLAWRVCEQVRQFIEQGREALELVLIGAGFVDPLAAGNVRVGASAALACVAAIGHEHPALNIRVVDVPATLLDEPGQAQDLAEVVLRSRALPRLCALRSGHVWTREHEVLPVLAGTSEGDGPLVCLVSGGLGTVGFGMASYLARHHGADLVLVQRPDSGDSARRQLRQQRLQALRDLGVRVDVVDADITERDALFAALAQLQVEGVEPNAFVHAAGPSGNLTQQWLMRSTAQQWQTLLAAKWQGACLLHEWFSDRPTRFGCFVSSLAVLAGGLGLAPYAAANEACAYWHHRGSTQRPYFAIDWDGWEGWEHSEGFIYGEGRGTGLAAAEVEQVLTAIFSALGRYRRFIVSSTPLAARLNPGAQAAVVAATAQPNKQLCDVEAMTQVWQQVLHGQVTAEANFFDLGGDSLVGSELIRQVNLRFGVSLSMVDLFEFSNARALAAQVVARQGEAREGDEHE